MNWDPNGIVAGEEFRSYVEELRETSKYASGGGNAHFSENMNDTTSDEDAQTVTKAVNTPMTRRAFTAGVGAAAATAAGAGTAAAQESDDPNWSGDYVQSPVIEETVTIDEHSADMDSVLEYINDSGEIVEHSADVATREDAETVHNPVTLRADRFATYEYREFPRGETFTNADDEEEDLNAVDAQHWTVDESGTAGSTTLETVTAANGENALHVAASSQGAGDVAKFTFSDVDITSGVDRKYIQLVANVVGLGADTAVYIRAVDSSSNAVETWIDSGADDTALGTIATATGTGITYQAQTGEFSTSLDDIQEVEITIEDGDADLELPAINLDRESRWEFGSQEYLDSDDEVQSETLYEPSGEFSITSFDTVAEVFTSSGIMGVTVDVELDVDDLEASVREYRWKDAGRYDYEERLETLIGYELETAYDLSYDGGRAVDEVLFPGSRYLNSRYSRESELPSWDDVGDISWTDETATYEDANVDEEVTLTSTVNPGELLVFNFEVLMDSDEREEATASSGGAGGGPVSSGGGFFSSIWGILATAGAGVIGYVMWAKRRATGA